MAKGFRLFFWGKLTQEPIHQPAQVIIISMQQRAHTVRATFAFVKLWNAPVAAPVCILEAACTARLMSARACAI